MAEVEDDAILREGEDDVRDTDIVFDCPRCGKRLVIDYRGAGLEVACTGCGERVLVPIPDGMMLDDLDLDPGEILKQLFATRRNYRDAMLKVEELRSRLVGLQETVVAMQSVIAEGLASA